jgi:hypothetical protein
MSEPTGDTSTGDTEHGQSEDDRLIPDERLPDDLDPEKNPLAREPDEDDGGLSPDAPDAAAGAPG